MKMLLQRKIVSATSACLMKACWNHIPNLPPPAATTALREAPRNLSPSPAATPRSEASTPEGSVWKSYGNPCIDTFYYLLSDIDSWPPKDLSASHDFHMKRLLPHAWSYCPLTTLKIIRNLKYLDHGPMCDAIYWLHHNHPITLAANLIPLLINFPLMSYQVLTSFLYRILDLKKVDSSYEELEHFKEINNVISKLRKGNHDNIPDPLMVLHNKVLDMYEHDHDFRCLHDQIAHLFAESLKFDIQNFLKKEHDFVSGKDLPLEVTEAADYCDASPFLLESVAKIVFPHVGEVEEAAELLRNDVLDPLRKVLCPYVVNYSPENRYGYIVEGLRLETWRKQRSQVLLKYLKDLEKSLDKMDASAVLPNELVQCVIGTNIGGDVSRHAVELQWNAMVEDLKKKKGGHLSSSLALIQTIGISSNNFHFSELACAMTILFSELSEEEEWKGKVISLTPDPQILSIEGRDLLSKSEFLCDKAKMHTLGHGTYGHIDCKKVFDLILQRAVSTSLKPKQMIKKVFVFSMLEEFEWTSSGSDGCWEVQDYDEMKRKYREHGYDIPQIVFWRSNDHIDMPFTESPDERGIAAISGFHRACRQHNWAAAHFVKMFLENDGHVSPQHVMDAILCDEDYNYAHRFIVLD